MHYVVVELWRLMPPCFFAEPYHLPGDAHLFEVVKVGSPRDASELPFTTEPEFHGLLNEEANDGDVLIDVPYQWKAPILPHPAKQTKVSVYNGSGAFDEYRLEPTACTRYGDQEPPTQSAAPGRVLPTLPDTRYVFPSISKRANLKHAAERYILTPFIYVATQRGTPPPTLIRRRHLQTGALFESTCVTAAS